MRNEQAKTAEDAAQGCLGTVPNLQVGSSLGVRRGRGGIFAMVVPPLGGSTSAD